MSEGRKDTAGDGMDWFDKTLEDMTPSDLGKWEEFKLWRAQEAEARIENEELFQATASERKDAMRKWHAAAAKTKAKRSSGTNKLVHPGALIGGQS